MNPSLVSALKRIGVDDVENFRAHSKFQALPNDDDLAWTTVMAYFKLDALEFSELRKVRLDRTAVDSSQTQTGKKHILSIMFVLSLFSQFPLYFPFLLGVRLS
jgi:hypothetical protein